MPPKSPRRLELELILEELERRKNKKAVVPFCPHTPFKQQQIFLDLECREALYGGAAGGGKSDALLMCALKYAEVPNYKALILRRTFQDLAKPGAIMDRAKDWLAGSGARWADKDHSFIFPSGARLVFGHMESAADRFNYQSAEFHFIAFDELTHFREHEYTYMFSRLRRLQNSQVPTLMRGASNPGGIGHDWVYKRFILEPEGRIFVSAKMDDNIHIDRAEYEANLKELDHTTYQQLRNGMWVKDESKLIYKIKECNLVSELPDLNDFRQHSCVLGVDLGTSQSKPTTAFVVQAFSPYSPVVYTMESFALAGMTPSSIAEQIKSLQEKYTIHRIIMDQGGLGGGYIEEMRQRWGLPVDPAEKSNKQGFRRLLNGDLHNQKLRIIKHDNEGLITELNNLLWDNKERDCEPGSDDHLSDAWLYSWREAKHWAYSKPLPKPEVGSEEWEEELWKQQDQEKEFSWV